MKKFFLLIIFFLILGGGLFGYIYYSQDLGGNIGKNSPGNRETLSEKNTEILSDNELENGKTTQVEKTGEELVQEKIAKIRKRLALKGLIIEGDGYLISGEHTLALKKYLDFYRENPEDPLIIEKLGDTYFAMHKYESAGNYYERLETLSGKYFLSSFHAIDFNNISEIKNLLILIQESILSPEEKFYYQTSLECSLDFHQCKKDFGEYFWPEEGENNTGENKEKEITFQPLLDIKIAIENYRNFQLDDIQLKNAYIIGAWYKHNLYSLTAFLGEKELTLRPDYKPMLKIVAQSYFNLGEYEKSRAFLGNYNTIENNDADVHYMLGIVNSNLREYVLANIHLQKAIDLGTQNTLDARKALIFNYSLLDDTENMLKNFRLLIEKEDYLIEDFSLAAYHHIMYDSYDWIQEIAPEIGGKFPNDASVYAYLGWIQREKGDFTAAKKVFAIGESIDANNPFLLLNIAYNEKDLGNNSAALIYFKKTISSAENSEFAVQAKKEIANL